MTTEAKIRLKVVDADGHYMEPQDLRPYIEAKYRDVAPHRIVKEDGAEDWGGRDWISEGSVNFGNVVFTRESEEHQQGLLAVSGTREADGAKRQKSMYGSLPPGAVESAARLGVMDDEGIDAAVMYPTGALTWIPDSDYHIAVNRALNDWLAEWCSEDPQRMMGATNIVAIHDVEAACEEVRRCYDEHNFRAVFLRDTLPNADVKWWHDTYDPFWRTCEELGVAIGFHPFPGDSMFGSASLFDIIGPDSERMYMRTPFNHPVDGMHTIMGIITGGICERFPGLAFRDAGKRRRLARAVPRTTRQPVRVHGAHAAASDDDAERVLPPELVDIVRPRGGDAGALVGVAGGGPHHLGLGLSAPGRLLPRLRPDAGREHLAALGG